MTIFKDGQAVGPYRIVRCIGRGGMGEVYEVEHESLGDRQTAFSSKLEGREGLCYNPRHGND